MQINKYAKTNFDIHKNPQQMAWLRFASKFENGKAEAKNSH